MPDALWCVIPAAGAGRRFGTAVPKQYQTLMGKPMLVRTMERMASHPRIAGLVVALADDDRLWPGLVLCAGKPVRTCAGGRERADSVLAGLHALSAWQPAGAHVLVHDAARPCVTHDDIDRLIDKGTRHPVGALLAAPVRDTVKRVVPGQAEVQGSSPRENLWRAFTPQLFVLGELIEAMTFSLGSAQRRAQVTDEASALEAMQKNPLLVEGSEDNLKVTTTSDMLRAERILRGQGQFE